MNTRVSSEYGQNRDQAHYRETKGGHTWLNSSHRLCYAGVCTYFSTHLGPGRVRWSATRPQIPNGRSTHLGPHTQTHHTGHIHTQSSHVIFHVSGHLIVDTQCRDMTRWSGAFSLQGDIAAHAVRRSALCERLCLFPCPHFSHMSTHKSHTGGN